MKVGVFIAGLFIIMVSMMVLIGYVFGLDKLTNWKLNTAMAVPTALCFISTGIALIILGVEDKNKKP